MKTDFAVDAAPPGRVARKRAEVRRKLMCAGFDLTGSRGLNEFAIADLTEAADCSKGAFYSHFESRDAFVAELVIEGIEAVGDAIDRHGASLSGDEALSVGLRYALTLALEQPGWGSFVAAVSRSLPSFTEAGFGQRLSRDLSRAHAEGALRFNDPRAALLLASGVFLAGVIGVTYRALEPPTPDEATRHVLLGLGVAPDRARDLCSRPLPALQFTSMVVRPLHAPSG